MTPEQLEPHPDLKHLFTVRQWASECTKVKCTYYALKDTSRYQIEVCTYDKTGSPLGIGVKTFGFSDGPKSFDTLTQAMEYTVLAAIQDKMS
jgi:hypothetical protein